MIFFFEVILEPNNSSKQQQPTPNLAPIVFDRLLLLIAILLEIEL